MYNCGKECTKYKHCCARCRSANYCCKECQIKDWPRHKPVCKRLKDSSPDDDTSGGGGQTQDAFHEADENSRFSEAGIEDRVGQQTTATQNRSYVDRVLQRISDNDRYKQDNGDVQEHMAGMSLEDIGPGDGPARSRHSGSEY